MKNRTVFTWILRRVSRRLPALGIITLTHAGSAIFGVAFALGTRGVIDSAVAAEPGQFARACLVQLAIICGMLLCAAISRYLTDRVTTYLDRDWKRMLLDGLLHGEYAQVSAYHSGELVNRMNNDVHTLNSGLVSVVPGLVAMVVRLTGAIAVLIAVEPWFTAALAAAGVVAVIGTGIAHQGLKSLNKKVSQTEGRVLSFLQEALERLLVVQAMDLSDEVERRADGLLEERLQIQRRRRRMTLIANTCINVMYHLAGFAALAWCAFSILRGRMSFGTLTAVTQLVSQIQGPFINLSGIIPQYAATAAAGERLMELEQIRRYPARDRQDLGGCYDEMEAIGAEDVSFAYDREEVFQSVSFSLPKGAFAAVTGASGIGKSTLLKLFLGVFTTDRGTLYVRHNGQRTALSRNTRGLFAYVPQGNFLFSGTLRENLLISRPEATQQEIEYAVHISAMDRFLDQLPDGLDSVIGENGTGLSEGQVQRLAIARAVLSGAPILLLDEATSALDVETERMILERIAAMPERTCIAVTHRPAALQLADWQLEVADKTIRAHKRAQEYI